MIIMLWHFDIFACKVFKILCRKVYFIVLCVFTFPLRYLDSKINPFNSIVLNNIGQEAV